MHEGSILRALFDETEANPLSVSELTSAIRSTLEREFASVWVEGEIIGFTAAKSGHWYMTLADSGAKIKCVCWKGSNYRIRFRPEPGMSVRMRGRLAVYPPSGEYQLVVESLEPAGEGALAAAFEQIRARLERDGLFEPSLKRPLPFFPRKIGVITSQTGAAYHDIFTVLTRRARSINLILLPTLVQGETAADKIREAIQDANDYNLNVDLTDPIEVLIVGRGGGSAEDLWAFNDEMLARAIRASNIPVISAVGHEIDTTIADLVADVRAATPSAAAEIVAGRELDILNSLVSREEQMIRILDYKLLDADSKLCSAASASRAAFADKIFRLKNRYTEVNGRMSPAPLFARIESGQNRVESNDKTLRLAFEKALNTKNESLKVAMAKLNVLSPLAVLDRGYSIAQAEDGSVIRDSSAVSTGDVLSIRLAKGKITAEVLLPER